MYRYTCLLLYMYLFLFLVHINSAVPLHVPVALTAHIYSSIPVHMYSAVPVHMHSAVPVPVPILPRCSAKGEAATRSGRLVSPTEGGYTSRGCRCRYPETGASSGTRTGSGTRTESETEERGSPARMDGGIGDYTRCRCG